MFADGGGTGTDKRVSRSRFSLTWNRFVLRVFVCSLYPVVPGNGRFVSENEVIVDNYLFPKKVGEQD